MQAWKDGKSEKAWVDDTRLSGGAHTPGEHWSPNSGSQQLPTSPPSKPSIFITSQALEQRWENATKVPVGRSIGRKILLILTMRIWKIFLQHLQRMDSRATELNWSIIKILSTLAQFPLPLSLSCRHQYLKYCLQLQVERDSSFGHPKIYFLITSKQSWHSRE